MMIASEAEASITSDSLIPPVWAWITFTPTCSCGTLAISSSSASSKQATSALSTIGELLELALARLLEDLFQCDLARLAAGDLLGLDPCLALLRELTRAALVLDDLDVLAGFADAVEAEHLDGHPPALPP